MSDRVVFRVKFNRHWAGNNPWEIWLHGGVIGVFDTRSDAILFAASWARKKFEEDGIPSQLVVYTKRGRISFERTYGKDPKRRKG